MTRPTASFTGVEVRVGGAVLGLLLLVGLLIAPGAAWGDGPATIGSIDRSGDRVVPPALAGRLADEPSAGIAGLVFSSRAAADRRKLGLPSYAALLGPSWKRKAAKADRLLAAGLAAVPGGRGRSARASAQPSPTAVFDQKLGARDTLKGAGGKQTRTLRVATSLSGGCPQLNELGTGYGWSGVGRATYVVTTTERVGRFDLITSVVFDGSFRTRPEMLNNATAASYSSADFGEISITRNQESVERRTGKRREVGETERFNSSLDPFYGPDESFRSFVASQEDGAPAPPRRLTTGAWKEAAVAFMAIPYDALRRRVLEAERLARTPNACVTLGVDAPSHLAPDQTVELTGVARSTQPAPGAPIKFAGAIRGEWINPQGQTATPLSSIERMRTGGPWYSFTAPAQRWQDPVGVDLELVSGAGIARTAVTFKAEDTQLYFEIVGASIETQTTASRPSSYCGEVGGRQAFTGNFSPQPFSPEDHLSMAGGQVSGGLEAIVNAVWHDHVVKGCRAGDAGAEFCEAAMPNRTPSGDGSWPVSLSFEAAADPSELTLVWRMEDPEVGFVDAGDAECNAHVWGYFPTEIRRRTIPRAALQATGPVTLSFAGSGHLDQHAGFDPASIDHSWEYTITVRRTDAQGVPLG